MISGLCQYPAALGIISRYNILLLPSKSDRCVSFGTLFGVGVICFSPQLQDLEAQFDAGKTELDLHLN